ncbi:MAG TPA: hypothetical protein VIX38_05400 [Nitrososphaeraceae archaeon]
MSSKKRYVGKQAITISAGPNLTNQATNRIVLFISIFMGTVPALTKKSGVLNPSNIIFATSTEPLTSPS